MGAIIKLALYCLLIYGVTVFVPGVTIDALWPTAIIAGLVFFVLNTLVKPIVKLLTLPINIITLGLFSIVINALMFWLIGFIVAGFDVVGVQAVFVGGIVASIGAWLISVLMKEDDK